MNLDPRCLVCGSRRLLPVLRSETVPACSNVLLETQPEALNAPTATMLLTLCRWCGHLFNAAFDQGLVEYRPGYENSLQGAKSFREYDAKLVEDLVARNDLHGKTVVEIGCGRGEFLQILCGKGNRGLGFDPSYPGDGSEFSETLNIKVLPERYESQTRDLEVDLICSRHTLEHVEDPQKFLRSIGSSTQRIGTALFLEVPNGLYTLRDGGIWDLIHEHCSYFTPQSLKRVLELSDYRSIEVNETFEGQFLTARAKTGYSDHAGEMVQIDYLEELAADFAKDYWSKVEHWNLKFRDFAEREQKVIVWGGGSKGISLLNILRPQNIQFLVDVNPIKHGKYIPGTGQRIIPPNFLTEYRPDVIIVMNPNYREEIAQQVSPLGLQVEFLGA
jgi:SAM-dependent methyltransferase